MLNSRLPTTAAWPVQCLVGIAVATGLYLGEAGALLVSTAGLLVTWATFEHSI